MSNPQTTHRLLNDCFLQYAEEIERYFTWKIGAEEAADLTQEVYLHALAHTDLGSLRQPKAFLFRIAANLVVDTYRKRGIRHRYDGGPLPELDEIPCTAPGPEKAVSEHLELQRFRELLGELPPLVRHAFLLNRLDGLSHADIANHLGISRKTVERHI